MGSLLADIFYAKKKGGVVDRNMGFMIYKGYCGSFMICKWDNYWYGVCFHWFCWEA